MAIYFCVVMQHADVCGKELCLQLKKQLSKTFYLACELALHLVELCVVWCVGSLLCSLEMESLSAGYLVLFPVIECFFFGQLKLTVQSCKICFG